tara:strand:+ start:3656 stop:3838 length:183 start_codon:yes stop_codon:yes gene_type:complete
MPDLDLIHERQYAANVIYSLNIRPCRVDLVDGIVYVPKGRVADIRKVCKKFDWPLQVSAY